jgi:hypothetical protein
LSKTIDVDKRVVVVDVLIKMTKNDPTPTAKTWTLDYADVDLDDLLERASRTDVITLQARYRNKPFEQSAFNVAADISVRPVGVPKDPKTEALRQLSRMTGEERDAFLAEVMASLK